MSVSRKLFLTIASFIVAMSLVFTFVTEIVLRDALTLMVQSSRKKEVSELSKRFIDYYKKNKDSWNGVRQINISKEYRKGKQDTSILLFSKKLKLLYATEDANSEKATKYGIREVVRIDGQTIAFLYYYDPEIAYISKLRIGIQDSVKILPFAGATVFVLISLVVAYWLSKRLTTPLRLLIPIIDRLGEGQLGVQSPIVTNDEYGKVAQAFNKMSKQLQHAEDARKNLVADVAHELRTPLTIIQGKLDLIQQEGRSIEPENLLPMQDELIRLTRLVEDLHQLSLAETKKLPLDRKTTQFPSLLQRIIDRVTPDADSKEIKITLHYFTNTTVINVDPNRMTQVFLNLLINAVRYTPSGGSITLTVEEEIVQTQNKDFLRITITDTGAGIEPEHLPFLFNRFYRTDEARTRNSGGMGLGLAIAKEFVLAHKGTIDVKSSLGKGTTFIVKLPI
ncbi:sensor histidine kinase [Thermoflavimicrobium daqui]|jgi:two-component system sensor histidine kinase BaeS|uniref:histidine kinase n=1 Tax=Thermoflavimicrobium daqui TaxID=2137476 RepID=A0A364K497_9BACL|nr:ATP-binding protein [Thermoflavimicrobium daqui]RAL24089.1 two-component sensor histidine kinase [Thermoflavimicrobium daqui]